MRTRLIAFFAGPAEHAKILVAAALFVLLRSPKLLLFGRVYAEEGTVYLRDAWNGSFPESFLRPHQGYYSLVDNFVAALAASIFPLQIASWVFEWSALLLLLLLIHVVITSDLFVSTEARLLAALLCVISPSLEVWLTLEDMQFCLAVAAAIILLSNPGRHRVLHGFTLLLGGLTGPVTCALLPFAWARAYLRKERNSLIQALILTVCTAVQGVCLVHAFTHGERAIVPSNKWQWIGPVILTKVVCLTFATRLSFFLVLRLLLNHYSVAMFTVCWLLAIAGVVMLARMASLAGRQGWWLFVMAFWSLVFAYAGVAESHLVLLGGANRYFFVPDLLLWLMILLAWQNARKKPGSRSRRWMNGFVAFLIVAGLIDSAGYWWKEQAIAAPWAAQIRRWEVNPSTKIVVSPSTWQPLILDPHDARKSK